MVFRKPKKVRTAVSDQTHWNSACECYTVIESKIRYGRKDKLPVLFYAMKRCGKKLVILSKHRKLKPAQVSCEKHDRRLK